MVALAIVLLRYLFFEMFLVMAECGKNRKNYLKLSLKMMSSEYLVFII